MGNKVLQEAVSLAEKLLRELDRGDPMIDPVFAEAEDTKKLARLVLLLAKKKK